MKGTTIMLPVAIIAISLSLLAFLPLADLTLVAHFVLPPCPHVALVTAPRHGSTWFVDSVEGCPSRESAHQNYHELIFATELWTNHVGPVHNLTAEEAADYLTHNCSVKIFPSLKMRGEERVRELFTHIKERNIPVFLLRRGAQDVYESMTEAMENGGWSKITTGPTERNLEELESDDEYNRLQKKLDGYFGGVRHLMFELGLTWDEMQYEEIRNQRRIVGRQNRCVIQNCNFM